MMARARRSRRLLLVFVLAGIPSAVATWGEGADHYNIGVAAATDMGGTSSQNPAPVTWPPYCPPPPCPPSAGGTQTWPPAQRPSESSTPGAQPSQPAESGTAQQAAPATAPETPEQTSLEGEQAGATGGQLAAADGGYLDDPIPGTRYRFRADGMFDDTTPDRAEFIYAKCGCFGGNAKGPTNSANSFATEVNYQELSHYLELAFSQRFSIFAEVPVRFIQIQFAQGPNLDAGGLGDVNAGFKYALIACPDHYLTAELRAYAPSGDVSEGLGTGHASIEPGLLYWRRISERISIQGELRDWQALGGSDFAGNVLRYGGEFGYDLVTGAAECPDCHAVEQTRLTMVTEVVGWTVLSGKETDISAPGDIGDAAGDTIVNLKLGPRWTWGDNSFYGGWGHALTKDAWYRDMLRLEYVRNF
jgi:hypothetical protein